MDYPQVPPPTTPDSDSARTLRIVGLVAIGCVVLCGLVGSCIFFATLLLPALQQ